VKPDRPRTPAMRLSTKIALVFSSIILVAMAASTLVTIAREVKEKKEDARLRMAHTAAVIRLSMGVMNRDQLVRWVDSLYTARFDTKNYNLDLVYVVIEDQDGAVVVSSVNPKARLVGSETGAVDPDRIRELTVRGLRKVEVTVEDEATGRARATIHLGYYVLDLFRGIGWMIAEAIAVTAVLIVGASLVSVLFSRRLTRPLVELVSGMERVGRGDFRTRVNKRTDDEIGFLADGFNAMTEGLREREFIRDTFKRYVTTQIAEKLLAQKDRIRLTGEKRNITVLFCDIKGFTPMAERTEPVQLVSTLNDYFSVMVDIIFKHEGVLDKFIGDAIMAFWNAPLDQDDAARRAVTAALEMQAALVSFNDRRRAAGKPPIHAGIGINTGDAVAGTIGSEKKMEYTVIGDTVNVAQRLESVSRPGQVLVSDSTYAVMGGRFVAHRLPPQALKGLVRPIGMYEVVGIR
jgi:class 3 adenylate cyclase